MTYTNVTAVQVGDTIVFGGTEVRVERITVAESDGWIGLHGNNGTWITHCPPGRPVIVIGSAA